MSKLLVRPGEPAADGAIVHVTPETAGWKYVGFSAHRLTQGQSFDRPASDQETCIVVLSGKVDVVVGDTRFEALGERESVFDALSPYCVYVPCDYAFTVTGLNAAEVAICTAPGGGARHPYLITPDAIGLEERGEGTNTRHVRAIMPGSADAESLLIYEVITPGGNWSSYPPHKHDTDNLPEESALEETYFHKINPSQGFAFQRVYTDDRDIDETMTVQENDLVLVPRGYHPVGAPHGYDVYYLNVMAGHRREWVFKNDPAHEWMLER